MRVPATATGLWRAASDWWGRRSAGPRDFRTEAPSIRRTGIVSVADPAKGLWRDTQCLLWALGDEAARDDPEVSVFCCRGFGKLGWDLTRIASVVPPEPIAGAAAPGMELSRWSQNVDRVVLVQASPIAPTRSLLDAGLAVVWIPNLDWLGGDSDVDGWVRAAIGLRDTYGSRFEVWAKTPGVAARLAARGIDTVLVPWSIPDRVRERRARSAAHVEFLFNAGMGGWRGRRGLDLTIEAFLRAVPVARTPIRLTIKSIQPCAAYLPPSLHEALRHPAIRVVEEFVDRVTLSTLHDAADAVVYPSRWDGFGLSLLEALHHALPVLVTDGDPMNELVRDGRTGLLVPARQVGTTRLAPHWECDVDGLAAAMARFADDPDLRARLTCGDPESLRARQDAFRRAVHRQLLARAAA